MATLNRFSSVIVMCCCLWTVACLSAQPSSQPQAEFPRGSLRLMWYNVENLFHPSDDSIAGDDAFTPGGERHWSFSFYNQKLTKVAKVIVAAGQWDPPDLVGVGEVENAMVLEDLVSHPILKPYRYSYLHRDGPDHRGMEVACLYRHERFHLFGWSALPPAAVADFGQTREMMHIHGTWGRRDTLDLFLVHFISRYRGSGATAEYRKMQSARLAFLADSVHRVRPGSLVVMAGDFNEPWEGYALEPFRINPEGRDTILPLLFAGSRASYKYRGIWSAIDQFLISGASGGYGISGSVFQHPALFVSDETYGGVKPYRTYEGYGYAGGFSDHLPILMDINPPLFSRGSER